MTEELQGNGAAAATPEPATAAAPEPAAPAALPAIEARGFSFTYPAGESQNAPRAGIGPVDWRVPEGAFQLVVGATGSGKTTLLRCLKPAIAPAGERAGELRVLGRPVDDLAAAETAGLVGFVFQSPENQIVCDTVWHELAFGLENLGVPQDEMRRRVAEVAHFFGIEPWFRRKVSELSGGQRQMVALAGVLAMQPRLLLLDEPTAQLDPVAEKNFLHALFRVNRELGITVVVATHAPEAMAEYATGAVELEGGRLREVSLERFAARPLEVPAGGPARASSSPAITVEDAYVRYGKDGDWVLRGLDLTVGRGLIHAVVGGNACGKTTLLNTVAGTLAPVRGRVKNRLARRQALMPQDPKALFVCDTVDEELREWQHACGYSDAEVERAAREFGLAGCLAQHPYDLSGGQQQLLAAAKLLLTDPDLLLLDEPTKGLDGASELVLARALTNRARGGMTVLVATHDLAFAALVADEVTMLFDGEAACTESADSFFEHNLFWRPVEDAFSRLWLAERTEVDATACKGEGGCVDGGTTTGSTDGGEGR